MAALVWRFSPRAGNGSRFMHGGPCRLAYRVNWMAGSKVTKSVWCPSSLPCSPAPEDDQRERLLQKREILQRLNEGSYCLTLHPIRNCCFCGMWTHYTLTYKHTLTCSFSPASLFLKMAAALRKATILATNFTTFVRFKDSGWPRWIERNIDFLFSMQWLWDYRFSHLFLKTTRVGFF